MSAALSECRNECAIPGAWRNPVSAADMDATRVCRSACTAPGSLEAIANPTAFSHQHSMSLGPIQ